MSGGLYAGGRGCQLADNGSRLSLSATGIVNLRKQC